MFPACSRNKKLFHNLSYLWDTGKGSSVSTEPFYELALVWVFIASSLLAEKVSGQCYLAFKCFG